MKNQGFYDWKWVRRDKEEILKKGVTLFVDYFFLNMTNVKIRKGCWYRFVFVRVLNKAEAERVIYKENGMKLRDKRIRVILRSMKGD